MKTIESVMNVKGKEIWSISPDTSVFDALRIMSEKDIGAMPVMQGKRLVGIFSERDYARKVILLGKSSKNMRVSEIMSTQLVVISPNRRTEEGLALMTAKHVRHLPVIEGQKLVGFVSIGDLVRSIISDREFTIEQLENYIHGTGR